MIRKKKESIKKNYTIKLEKHFTCNINNISYPCVDNPEELLDIDDMGENDFFVACCEDKNEDKFSIHIWKGSAIDVDQNEVENYLGKIKEKFFEECDFDKINEIEEVPFSETDEFMNLL